ncbi:hypothetical protein HN446_00810 [bacterium]|jgi:hypothetical protein|nr:hypothetical protein [bacterium]
MSEHTGPDQDTIYDIYDVWFEPFWHTWWFKVIVAVLVATILILFAFFVWKKFLRKKTFLWDSCLEGLDKIKVNYLLSDEKMLSKKHNKMYYINLIDCLKLYLCKRYGFSSLGDTDLEMVGILRKMNVDKFVSNSVEKIFDGAISIKFAQQSVVKKQMESDWDCAVNIVRSSIPDKDSI